MSFVAIVYYSSYRVRSNPLGSPPDTRPSLSSYCMVRAHARTFEEIIDRARAAAAVLPSSVCATAGSSLASGSDLGSVSPERSDPGEALLHTSPAATRAPLQAAVCNKPSSAWRTTVQRDREPGAYVWCLEEHGEHGENEGPIRYDSVGLDVVGTRQRWSAPMTSVCVGSGAWVAQGQVAAAGAASLLRGKVALLRWHGAEDAAAWAEQVGSQRLGGPALYRRMDAGVNPPLLRP